MYMYWQIRPQNSWMKKLQKGQDLNPSDTCRMTGILSHNVQHRLLYSVGEKKDWTNAIYRVKLP